MLKIPDIIKITNKNIKEIIMTHRLNAKTAKKLRKLAAVNALEAGAIISHTDYVELTREKPNEWTTGPLRVGKTSMKYFYKELKKYHKKKK
jgi:hypothetical protein